jgi:hypothetical protein
LVSSLVGTHDLNFVYSNTLASRRTEQKTWFPTAILLLHAYPFCRKYLLNRYLVAAASFDILVTILKREFRNFLSIALDEDLTEQTPVMM